MTAVDISERRKRDADTLWRALAAAQAEFGPLVKNTQGQRGKYAPLDQVLDVLRPVLNKHGLVLTQPTAIEGETLVVRTLIVHKDSGEMHECVYPAGLLSLQHQQLGAGVSYARRYSLLSLAGVFPENEDDDGEKAGAAGGGRTPPRQQLNASQAKKENLWPQFVEKCRAFTDLDALEAWWADARTQAYVNSLPNEWQVQAAEEYEKRQEALYEIIAKQ